MLKKLVLSVYFCLLCNTAVHCIHWNGNWAYSCDFKNRDMGNVKVRGEKCGEKCAENSGCTHFTWTDYEGGTCWLKSGPVTKNDAFEANNPKMVCGIIRGSDSKGVRTTRHPANEIGACELPRGDYAVIYPVALGNQGLGDLAYRADLCGHILTINCGYGPLDIIITNSNLGGGLDLYASTWSIATNNLPPGVTQCDVSLSNRNPFTFDNPICYYATGETDNQWYHSVGLLNTKNRIIKGAALLGRFGQHTHPNGSPYYIFNFYATKNDQVTFYFEDGGSHSVFLRDCLSGADKQYWS